MTKAKMPVAQYRKSRTEGVRANRMWTDELTFIESGAGCVDPFGSDPYAPSGRRSRCGK